MVAMPAAADSPAPDAVAALVAVTSCDADPSRGDAAVRGARRGRRAAAALAERGRRLDPRPARGRRAAGGGGRAARARRRRPRGGARRTAATATAELEIARPATRRWPAALARCGRAARARDARSRPLSRGLVVVAGRGARVRRRPRAPPRRPRRGAAHRRGCSTRCGCATTSSARWPRSSPPTSACSAAWASTSTTAPPSSCRWRSSRCSCSRPTSPTPRTAALPGARHAAARARAHLRDRRRRPPRDARADRPPAAGAVRGPAPQRHPPGRGHGLRGAGRLRDDHRVGRRVRRQRGLDHPADHPLPDPPGDAHQRPAPRPGDARRACGPARTRPA